MIMTEQLSLFVAFIAGLLSFFSPCILPIIPSYLCFIGGAGSKGGINKYGLFAKTASFILGFSCVFIITSILLATTFALMRGVTRYINIAAGVIVIMLGLNILFDFLNFLNYEKRFHPAESPTGFFGAFLVGAAFGAGWTPCVGPMLGSILLIAGQSGNTGRAVLYLAVYSLGLGAPFLIAAAFFDHFMKQAVKIRRFLPLIKKISGIFLILVGFLILFGQFRSINSIILQAQYRFIDWVSDGGIWVTLIPALVLFLAAVIPPLILAIKKKPVGLKIIVPCGVLLILSALQMARLIDCAGLLAGWLIYVQSV